MLASQVCRPASSVRTLCVRQGGLVIIAALCSALSVASYVVGQLGDNSCPSLGVSVASLIVELILHMVPDGRATSISQMAALADDKKAQLREWFASARRRSLPVVPVTFDLTAADLFARPASKSGGAFDPDNDELGLGGPPASTDCAMRT